MYLEIITPEKKLFSGEAELIRLPGTSGSFEVLMNHAPVISTLGTGQIKVSEPNGKLTHFDIESGVVENINNRIIVLVDVSGSIQ